MKSMFRSQAARWIAATLLLLQLALASCSAVPTLSIGSLVPTASTESGTSQLAPTPAPIVQTSFSTQGSILLSQEDVLASLYERVNPSVVNITTESGTGSGFVYDQQGHIVTNNHVVSGADEIWVTFSDSTMVEAAVVGTDPGSDLAVLKVDVDASHLSPVALGDYEALRVGQMAIAIGNPFGLAGTMTVGIVSALGRVLQAGTGNFSIVDLVQTDAPINPGNSGGPLLDSDGRVIGVNTLIFSSTGTSSGVGLAVPVSAVKRVVPQLIESGKFVHAWLGISGVTINAALAKEYSLPVTQGALVQSVTPGSPADLAGLRGATVQPAGRRMPPNQEQTLSADGDIIIAIDGQEVQTFDDLVSYLSLQASVGQQVTLTILRDGRQQTLVVTLTERPTTL